MRILKYGKNIIKEKRKADFLMAFDREIETTRIVSFGSCNWHCSYCKRDGHTIDADGNIVRSIDVSDFDVFEKLEIAIQDGERIRLSGGDPVMHQEDSLKIAKWAYREHGVKISMATNGSDLEFYKKIAPYVDYVAIDLKGHNAIELSKRAGISILEATKALNSALDSQDFFAKMGVLVDIRTPIFADTSLDMLVKMWELINRGGVTKNKFWTLRRYTKVKGCQFGVPDGEYVSKLARDISSIAHIPIGVKEKWKNSSFNIYIDGKIINHIHIEMLQ